MVRVILLLLLYSADDDYRFGFNENVFEMPKVSDKYKPKTDGGKAKKANPLSPRG